MAVEAATHIDELDPATIGDTTDPTEGGAQISMIKTVLKTDFPNISAAVTATAADLNRTVVTTEGTATAGEVLTVGTGGAVDGTALAWSNLGTVTTAVINGGTVSGVTLTGITLNGISGGSALDTDLSSVSASHDSIPSAKAAKDYTDSAVSTGVTGLAATTYVDSAVSGLASEAYVDARVFTVVTAVIDDISTSQTIWVPMPVAGTVTRFDTVLQGAITAADANVDLKTAADAAMGSVVVSQSGSAAGSIDSDASISNATVTAGSALKVSTDGGSTGAVALLVSITVQI